MSAGTSFLSRFAKDFKTVAAGDTVFREGDPGDVMYVVDAGEVDLVIRDQVVYTVGPGGIFGEMALIDRAPRSATALARTDCQLVPIDEKRFRYLVQQTPFFALDVMRVMAERLRRLNEKVG
jgi:CRP-like cAMP-binding protein